MIGHIPSDMMCLFQAGVINYHRDLNKWFGRSLADQYPVGMLSIMYDRSPEQWDMTDQRLQRQLGLATVEFLSKYCADLKQEFNDLRQPNEFSIGVDYHLVLTKGPDKADITLQSGRTDGESTRIVEVPKDPSRSHPFRQTEILEQVGERLQINPHDIQCVNKVYGIKIGQSSSIRARSRTRLANTAKLSSTGFLKSMARMNSSSPRLGHSQKILPMQLPRTSPRNDPVALWALQQSLLSIAEAALGARDTTTKMYQPSFTYVGPHIRNTPELDGAFAE